MKRTEIRGRMKQYKKPNWEPLLYITDSYSVVVGDQAAPRLADLPVAPDAGGKCE
jgi:hypothetical protein